MRLFRVNEEDKYEEVAGENIRNLDDAVDSATKASGGTGDFVIDMQNGKAIVFKLNEGKLNFNPNTDRITVAREDQPAIVYDAENPRPDPRYEDYTSGNDFPEREPATQNASQDYE